MQVHFGDCTFDSEAHTLTCGGTDVRLTGKAFQLLTALVEAHPKAISKEALTARLWPDTFVSESNLAGLVKEVRAATDDDARDPRFIRTVHRFGYAFIAPVTRAIAANAPAAEDLSSLGERIAASVLDALAPRAPGRRYRANAEAHEQYLKGRHHWNRRTFEGIERARAHFEAAIAADASHAPAFAGIADCYIALASRDLRDPRTLFPKAQEAARRALQLDASLAEPHASMGAIHELFDWRWRDAEREYAEALRLDPSYVTARQWFALGLAHRGRFAEAAAQMTLAADSDPLSFILNASAAVVHYLGRDYSAADNACARALEINPHHEPAHFVRGLAFQQRALATEAKASLEKSLAISRGEPHAIAALGALGASEGDIATARARLEQLAQLAATRIVSPVHVATILTALGDTNEAVSQLEHAADAKSGWLVYVRTEPRFDPLRGEPRFEALVARISSGDA